MPEPRFKPGDRVALVGTVISVCRCGADTAPAWYIVEVHDPLTPELLVQIPENFIAPCPLSLLHVRRNRPEPARTEGS